MERVDPTPPESRTIPELLGDLVRDLNGLVRSEGRLLRAEVVEAGRAAATGVETMLGGALLLMVALLVLVQALVVALAAWLGPGLASLAVGVGLALLGIVMVLRGRASLRTASLIPDRTVEQARRDVQLIKEQL